MPNWNAYSEPWLLNMMRASGEYLKGICVLQDTEQTHWNSIPIYSIGRLRFKLANRVKANIWGRHHYSNETLLLGILKKTKPDIVMGHYGSFVAEYGQVWEKLSLRLLIHIHGVDAHLHLRDIYTGKPAQNPSYKNTLAKLSQKGTIVANSTYTKRLITKDFEIPPERIVVKYLSVPSQQYAKNHTNTDEVHIVSIGRLVDFKSPDSTIRAFDLACEKGLKGSLTLIGDGYLRVTCELERIRSRFQEKIRITGALTNEEAMALLKQADIFTQHNREGELSGQTECLGISVIEALSLGIPVVATRSGGVQETVLHGVNGLLVAPGDIQAHAEALLTLAKEAHTRSRMGKAGIEWVASTFSQEKERNALTLLYEETDITFAPSMS